MSYPSQVRQRISDSNEGIKGHTGYTQDKVEAIQKKIEAGTYQVREEDIADKILKSIAEKKKHRMIL